MSPLSKILAKPLLGLVWLYRNGISPLLGVNCRFEPTCSEYAVEALHRYGAFKGGWLMLKRVGRCHPWGGSGYDPVPPHGGSEPGSDPGFNACRNKEGKTIKASDVGRELLYPLTNRAIVYAMVFYWFLFGLVYIAKLFGIALLFLALPAYFRFLLYLLEARASGKPAPVPTIEMFNPADNLWTLTPLIHLAVGIWAGIQLASANLFAIAILAGVAILLIMPASMAVLAVTHAPLASLNPLTVAHMIRACGPAYFIVPATLIAVSTSFVFLSAAGVPLFLVNLGVSYEIILLFSMTGAVLHSKNVALQVEIEDPVEPGEEELERKLLQQRQKIANHAYGFISRGNREGGLAHIREWLEKETEVEQAWQWFFEEMLKWESKDPALFFAQQYLNLLLESRRDEETLKLIARCLHQNERWRPLEKNRYLVNEVLLRHLRSDLLQKLES